MNVSPHWSTGIVTGEREKKNHPKPVPIRVWVKQEAGQWYVWMQGDEVWVPCEKIDVEVKP